MQCATCYHENLSGAKTCSACGSPLDVSVDSYSPALPQGVRLQNGAYEVGEELGAGGFGITYKGHDLSLRRAVAIKEFFPAGAATRQNLTVLPHRNLGSTEYNSIKAKFVDEAQCLAQFSHPGIVRVFGVFEENNTAYMVMELLDGRSLEAYIREKGSLSESEVVDLAEKVGDALGVVHQAGLIHRDIKPDNIMRTKDGRLVLIDFGTARAFASDKTVKQTAMLTPGYAPLEQYGQHARFGAYTDIYALGATLYHALTGQVPPPATDLVSGVELKSPRSINPSVSQSVSDAIVWAMEVRTSDRPQHVQEFLKSLKSAAPRPTPNPTADKQLDEAKARANASIEKWKNAIAVVREAEKISGVAISLPARLTEGMDAAANQLKRADWATAVAVEKEAASMCSEIMLAAKSQLQKELAIHSNTRKKAQDDISHAQSRCEVAKADALRNKGHEVKNREEERGNASSMKIIKMGGEVAIAWTLRSWIIFAISCIIGALLGFGRVITAYPWTMLPFVLLLVGPPIVGIGMMIYGVFQAIWGGANKVQRGLRASSRYDEEVAKADAELRSFTSTLRSSIQAAEQKERLINDGLRLLNT